MFANLLRGSSLWWLCTVMVMSAGVCAQPCQAQRKESAKQAHGGAMKFRSIQKVIKHWSADQHLYVEGDIGVGRTELAELEEWLAKHGTHWSVVLMHDAEGQTFTTADGRSYSGMDAVEYALGMGLSNRTSFAQLEHPVTHEADGTVFVLFLKERKFSYFASLAQDRRQLGEANWIGELDQPAYRAMRSGGRIIDAVKETVKLINGKLERAIEAEQKAAAAKQSDD